MKNKEKYIDLIADYACNNEPFGITKTENFLECRVVNCNKCMFSQVGEPCAKLRRKWLEEEWHGLPQLSKEENTFLNMLNDQWLVMARDCSGMLCIYDIIVGHKLRKKGSEWFYPPYIDGTMMDHMVHINNIISNSYFQMVKWEDEKPWLISDLKALKVRDDV